MKIKAFKEYIKSVPETTYEQMERALRHHKFNIYIIAYVSGNQR